jgi:hypothetical protein
MNESQNKTDWVVSLITRNPVGVNKVLQRNGYSGILAAQSLEDMENKCREFIAEKGDEATVELLPEVPEYNAIRELHGSQKRTVSFFKATGNTDDSIFSDAQNEMQELINTLTIRQILISVILFLIGLIIFKK